MHYLASENKQQGTDKEQHEETHKKYQLRIVNETIHIGHKITAVPPGKPITANQSEKGGQLAHETYPGPANDEDKDKDSNDYIKRCASSKRNHRISYQMSGTSYP